MGLYSGFDYTDEQVAHIRRINAENDLLAHSPMGGHYCYRRNREHFEPCGCQCEGCVEAKKGPSK